MLPANVVKTVCATMVLAGLFLCAGSGVLAGAAVVLAGLFL